MLKLNIIQAKPNPAGKDKTRYGQATAAQLGGEWVDIKNTENRPVSLDGLVLFHLAYPADGGAPKFETVCILYAKLGPFESLRVHSGVRVDLSQLYPQDVEGAKWHMFTGRNAYVWNNREGDKPCVWDPVAKADADATEYDPYPPESVILVRQGAKLIPSVGAGVYR